MQHNNRGPALQQCSPNIYIYFLIVQNAEKYITGVQKVKALINYRICKSNSRFEMGDNWKSE